MLCFTNHGNTGLNMLVIWFEEERVCVYLSWFLTQVTLSDCTQSHSLTETGCDQLEPSTGAFKGYLVSNL